MMYGGGSGWMWIFWLLLVVGVVLLAVLAVRLFGGGVRGSGPPPGEPGPAPLPESRARQVLDERYARGDLSTEEFEERRRALGDGG